MSRLVWGISIVVAFTVLLTAKVFEIGIGASLSWWVVTLPIYGPFVSGLFVLILVGFVFALVAATSATIEYMKHKRKP